FHENVSPKKVEPHVPPNRMVLRRVPAKYARAVLYLAAGPALERRAQAAPVSSRVSPKQGALNHPPKNTSTPLSVSNAIAASRAPCGPDPDVDRWFHAVPFHSHTSLALPLQ